MVKSFAFNPFQENTYIVSDRTKECIIIDPGCYDASEKKQLETYIKTNDLKPVRLLNTHCHIDHVFGNSFVHERWGLPLEIHSGELPVLNQVPMIANAYGLAYPEPSPAPEAFLEHGDLIEFGDSKLKIFLTPGHSPASISFYNAQEGYLIAGDVLFRESIGRTDLPGGDFKTLLDSIRTHFWTLPDAVEVFPGHGPSTTIGYEKVNNPFLNGSLK